MPGLFHRRSRSQSGRSDRSDRSSGIVPGSSRPDANGGHGSPDWRSYDLVAETYERVSAPRTAEVAADLMALADPPSGGRALDVGTGTGVGVEAGEKAVGSDGVAVGVDPSIGMLRVGAAARPAIRLVAAEAIDLPFHDGTFDVVTANFVLSHFRKYDTALFDMLRVLKPLGRLAVTAWAGADDEFQATWRSLTEEVVAHELMQDALERAMPWEGRFRDPRMLEQTLRDAGLHPVRVERREYRFRMSLEDYVETRETAASGRFVRDMLGPEGWESFRERARATFRERFPDPLTDFREVLLAVGTKPPGWTAQDSQTQR
ncbi:MAG: methyltransferase domain-containing protein [Actinomycetota bacterium]|nr:methyltransferase domain-containing protein [Actinomycetota bacterium]